MITAEEARVQADEYKNGIFHAKKALKEIEENICYNSKHGEYRSTYYYRPKNVDWVDMIIEELQSNGYRVKCFEHKCNEGTNYSISIFW